FPLVLKGSPLLRAWLARLASLGAELRTRWRWSGFEGAGFRFDTPAGPRLLSPRVTVLALGGASWARLGSDGAWTPWLAAREVEISPWQPANMGLTRAWSPHMERHFGQPVKGVQLTAGNMTSRGEFVISRHGLEGGGLYALSRPLREGADLTLDLLPALSEPEIAARLAKMRPGETQANRLRKLGLAAVLVALVMEFARE